MVLGLANAGPNRARVSPRGPRGPRGPMTLGISQGWGFPKSGLPTATYSYWRGTGSRSWRNTSKPSTDLPCWSLVWITAMFSLHRRKRADLCRLLEIKREKHWSPILCYIIFIRIYLVPSAWFLINLFAYWARKMQTDLKKQHKVS